MARKHRFSIVVLLGAAVVAGFFALSRSVQLGAASSRPRLRRCRRGALARPARSTATSPARGAAGGGSEGAEGRDPIRVAGCPVRPLARFAHVGVPRRRRRARAQHRGRDGALGEAGGDD